MKKNLIALAVAAAIIAPVSAIAADSSNANTGPTVFGYAQITGSQQFGTGGSQGLVFGAHRIRLGFKGEAVPGVSYYFQYKWDGAWQSTPLNNTLGIGAIPGSSSGVQDAYINFAFIPEVQLQVGKFRIPVGLERTQVSGNELMFIQRSMNQSLGANRSAGVMFHSPDLMNTGVYYSLGIFDNHELSGARAAAAQYMVNIPASKEIDSWNVGANGGLMGLKYMAEYSAVTSYQGIEGANAQDWYVALAANLHQMTLTPDWLDVEPAVRYESFRYRYGAFDSTLGNTTIGVNYYVNPNNPYAARVQLNYVIPNGGAAWRALGSNNYPASNGYLYNTLALQFQAGF